MKRLFCTLVVLLVGLVSPVVAQTALAPAHFEYDDAAVHFKPSADFQRTYEHADFAYNELSALTPIASWIRPSADPHGQRTIILAMRSYPTGISLEQWSQQAQTDIRSQIDRSMIRTLATTRTANGMPALFIRVYYGEGFTSSVQYGYIVSDGVRGILLTISALAGTMSEEDARNALKDFSVVLYPVNRR